MPAINLECQFSGTCIFVFQVMSPKVTVLYPDQRDADPTNWKVWHLN